VTRLPTRVSYRSQRLRQDHGKHRAGGWHRRGITPSERTRHPARRRAGGLRGTWPRRPFSRHVFAAERFKEPIACDVHVLALVSAVVGSLSLAPLPSSLRAMMLAAFILTGPGLAVVIWMRLQTPAMVVAIPIVGLSIMTGFTVVLGWLNWWMPTALLLTLVGGVVGSALLHARRTGGFVTLALPHANWMKRRDNGPLILIVATLGTWVVLLPGLVDAPYSQFGLLFVGTGPGLAVTVTTLVGAFVWALRMNRVGTAVIAIAATIVVQRVTATLITEVPIYAWTYKHIGLVNYIHEHQRLPPRGVDIYSEWPAFFQAFAWFANVASIDPIVVAHWFAPVIHGLLAACVGALAMLVGLNVRQALCAAMIVELANWVGQDYFAPQALALILAVGVLALLVASMEAPSAGYLALVAFAALVPTHQLTPYWLLGVIVLLVVTRRIRPWWLPIPYTAILVGYLIPRMYLVMQEVGFSSNVVENGSGNVGFVGSDGKVFTSLICRGLSVAVVLAAGVATFVWWRQRRPYGIPAIMAFTSFVVPIFDSYGGEAIFRVYLYALPGCAILIAPLLDSAIGRARGNVPRRRASATVAAVVMAVAAVAGLQSYYGMWPMIVMYRSQLTRFEDLMASADGPVSIWSLNSNGFPARATADYVESARYDKNFDRPIDLRWPNFSEGFPYTGQFDDITAQAESSDVVTFFVFTEQADRAVEYYRSFTPTAVAEFKDQFRDSEFWSLQFRDDHSTVYQFHRQEADEGPSRASAVPSDKATPVCNSDMVDCPR